MSGGGSTTSMTLVGRLRRNPTDQQAWNAFVERYGRKIYAWCRRWGLQEADAQDVTQSVLLDLARQMAAFDYRPSGSFRGWLRTITHRAWCDFLTSRRRIPVGSNANVFLEQLSDAAASEDLLQQLEQECERELLEEAMARVRLRVQPHTWNAFILTALDGHSGAEVAARLKMNVGTVWVARSKIQKLLQEEMERLEAAE